MALTIPDSFSKNSVKHNWLVQLYNSDHVEGVTTSAFLALSFYYARIDSVDYLGCINNIPSIRENIDLSTPSGKLIFQFIASIAEFEKSLISERIKNSLAVKKALAKQSNSNWRCGRPPLDKKLSLRVMELRSEGKSIRRISEEMGNISKSSVERIIKINS